jgi:hypothetical protein
MYKESNADGRCEVRLECDAAGCKDGVTVIMPTRDYCQWELYRIGWRLHKKQQLCPKHSEIVARKLNPNRF